MHVHVHKHRPMLETIHRRRKWLRSKSEDAAITELREIWGATDTRHLIELIEAHDKAGRPYVSAIPARDDIPSWGEVMRGVFERVAAALSQPFQLER